MSKPTEVTRADFDAALARIEHAEAQDDDYNLVAAFTDRLSERASIRLPEMITSVRGLFAAVEA